MKLIKTALVLLCSYSASSFGLQVRYCSKSYGDDVDLPITVVYTRPMGNPDSHAYRRTEKVLHPHKEPHVLQNYDYRWEWLSTHVENPLTHWLRWQLSDISQSYFEDNIETSAEKVHIEIGGVLFDVAPNATLIVARNSNYDYRTRIDGKETVTVSWHPFIIYQDTRNIDVSTPCVFDHVQKYSDVKDGRDSHEIRLTTFNFQKSSSMSQIQSEPEQLGLFSPSLCKHYCEKQIARPSYAPDFGKVVRRWWPLPATAALGYLLHHLRLGNLAGGRSATRVKSI